MRHLGSHIGIARRLAAVGSVAFLLLGGPPLREGGLRTARAGETLADSDTDSGEAAAIAEAERTLAFKAQIAPLLAQHCLECHDATSRKGRLDLSRREAALAGGKAGPAIVPGKAEDSLLWQRVESDEMPVKRPSLPPRQKQLLREWIDAGAAWPVEVIDPSEYAPRRRAGENWVRRLTVPEYIETVRSALGVEVERDACRLLPPDLRADGFTNTAYSLNVDLGHVEAYARMARIIVERTDVVKLAAAHASCQETSDTCLREVISGIGKWLLRGPLEEREIAGFLAVSAAVLLEGGDFAETVGYVVEAMLQSPRFIYCIESQRGDGTARPAGAFELASRLSYILWGGPPDGELIRAADAGELGERGRVEAQVLRMLQDPRAVNRSSRFLHEWLDLDRLESLRPDPKRFPMWDQRLAADMRDETLAFFRHVAWEENRPLTDLLNAEVTFATPRLAAHYGLERIHGRALSAGEVQVNYAAGARKDGSPLLAGERDLEALHTFGDGEGDTIRDTSAAGEPLDLRIEDRSALEWRTGGLVVDGRALLTTTVAPKRLIAAIKKSAAVTLEAWITPADLSQRGPARILTLSSGTGERNFTLGQDGDRFDVRFRSTNTDGNGMPSLASPGGQVKARQTHVVYTRDAAGKATLYVDGKEQASREVAGDLSSWDDGFQLAMANETTKDRGWRGTFHRVSVHSRALTLDEVRSRGEGLSQYDLAPAPARGGLLTQGSVLTLGGNEASMVTRGLFVLQELLDDRVGNPPPCVDTTPVPAKPGLSNRAIAEARIADASCGGCHARFEPLAFGLERFDGMGAYHEADEHGNKLRDDGSVLFPGEDKPAAYRSSAELMDLLARSDRVRRTLTRKVAQFALGRPLVEADGPILESIHESAGKGGGTYASLITAIVMSDLVQMTRTETTE